MTATTPLGHEAPKLDRPVEKDDTRKRSRAAAAGRRATRDAKEAKRRSQARDALLSLRRAVAGRR
ncbi:MAG: hypothetical protein ACJ77M_06815 [Thermoleophilaceae bacterium]